MCDGKGGFSGIVETNPVDSFRLDGRDGYLEIAQGPIRHGRRTCAKLSMISMRRMSRCVLVGDLCFFALSGVPAKGRTIDDV